MQAYINKNVKKTRSIKIRAVFAMMDFIQTKQFKDVYLVMIPA